MRILGLALLLIALPLAGCVAPPPPPSEGPASPPAGPGHHAVVLVLPDPEAGLTTSSAGDLLACSAEPRRDEQASPTQVVVRVAGCAAVVEPLLLGGIPDDVRVDFEVRPGALGIQATLHVQGPEPASASLLDPWYRSDRTTHRREGEGAPGRDTVLAWDIPAPHDGPWRMRGGIDAVAVGRQWSATVTVRYA